MQNVLIGLPIALLVLGALCGLVQLRKAATFFLVWFALAALALASGIIASAMNDGSPFLLFFGFLVAWVMLVPSLWITTIVSFATSQRVSPAPIERVKETYAGLDEEQKARLHTAARKGAKVGAKYFAQHLQRKGRPGLAGVVGELANIL